MIDPKLLTPDNGFVEGCVVMVTWDDASQEPMFFEDFMRIANGSPFVMKTASIYPITGPMAVWNLIPAHVLSVNGFFDFTEWFTDDRGRFKRPIWANRKPQ